MPPAGSTFGTSPLGEEFDGIEDLDIARASAEVGAEVAGAYIV